jgi:hypothetical protein
MGNYRRVCRKAVAGSISVNRDLTTLALVRLVTSASVFWAVLHLVGYGVALAIATVYVVRETPRYTASVLPNLPNAGDLEGLRITASASAIRQA